MFIGELTPLFFVSVDQTGSLHALRLQFRGSGDACSPFSRCLTPLGELAEWLSAEWSAPDPRR